MSISSLSVNQQAGQVYTPAHFEDFPLRENPQNCLLGSLPKPGYVASFCCRSFLIELRDKLARSSKVQPVLQDVPRALHAASIVRHSLFAVLQFQMDRQYELMTNYLQAAFSFVQIGKIVLYVFCV